MCWIWAMQWERKVPAICPHVLFLPPPFPSYNPSSSRCSSLCSATSSHSSSLSVSLSDHFTLRCIHIHECVWVSYIQQIWDSVKTLMTISTTGFRWARPLDPSCLLMERSAAHFHSKPKLEILSRSRMQAGVSAQGTFINIIFITKKKKGINLLLLI